MSCVSNSVVIEGYQSCKIHVRTGALGLRRRPQRLPAALGSATLVVCDAGSLQWVCDTCGGGGLTLEILMSAFFTGARLKSRPVR